MSFSVMNGKVLIIAVILNVWVIGNKATLILIGRILVSVLKYTIGYLWDSPKKVFKEFNYKNKSRLYDEDP